MTSPPCRSNSAFRHLQTAFTDFSVKRAKYPRFSSKRKSRAGAGRTSSAFRFRDGKLSLAKIAELLDIRWSRPRPEEARPSIVTVTRDAAGRWLVSMPCDDPTVVALPANGAAARSHLDV